MTKIILSGCNGKMGRAITACVKEREDCTIVAGVDLNTTPNADFPVYDTFLKVSEKADVIIDFSNPALLEKLLAFAKEKNLPLVLATTGFTKQQTDEIHEAAKEMPIFFTFNMSLGINLLVSLSKKAAAILGDSFDIEIIEKHHNQKLDAPSGTAIMLANAINDTLNDRMIFEYDRHSKREKRPKNEIGIHSIRGGTIVGEHDVVFAGHDEVITLSHQAASKEVFAVGAVKAAIFMSGKAPGLYDMNDMITL